MSLMGFQAATGCHDRREDDRRVRDLLPPLEGVPDDAPHDKCGCPDCGNLCPTLRERIPSLVPGVEMLMVETLRCRWCGSVHQRSWEIPS